MTGKALWGGRFREGMDPAMVPLNLSLSVDHRLWAHDIRGSRAWARALVGASVLNPEEGAALDAGLERVASRLESEGVTHHADEDIHSLVERLLFEEAGPVAGKLHSGRSRNDQVATDLRLWGMAAGEAVISRLEAYARALLERAREWDGVILPGYTHLQQAQPVTGAHWALSHLWPALRDRDRFRSAVHAAGVLPLGSGALAGCPFPVDRSALAQELGFHSVTPNSLDAVSDRDWAAEFIFASALLGVHLSRLGEDLVLFSSREFGFVRVSDGFSTGSSLMPQKRNPDAAELIRGKSGRLVGNVAGLLTLLKGLPTGYNRDLQEEKSILFDSLDTLLLALPATTGMMQSLSLQPEAIRKVMDPQLLATDLAERLVRAGVPFRTSHEVVGGLVREAEEAGVPLHQLPRESFQAAHAAFGEGDPDDLFNWERSVRSRDAVGGTGPGALQLQLEAAEARLEEA